MTGAAGRGAPANGFGPCPRPGRRALFHPRNKLCPEKYVYRKAVRCPFCKSRDFKFKTTKSENGGDGTRTRYSRCLNPSCGRAFRVIIVG
jgi:hypothetical protein